jgi:membrane associated rhomboid family serine protease
MPPRARDLVLGRLRLPRVIAGLILAIALVSIGAALGVRHGAGWIGEHAVLVPARVWRGEAWRLLTWVLCEVDPLTFLLACLTLGWVGSSLARVWGAGRFLAVYFGLAAIAGVVTCLVGRLLAGAADAGLFAGGWPVLDGLIVAWGLLHPTRAIRLYGVVPLTGRHLVWLTLGGTLLYALFYGLAPFVPHFAAELVTLGALGPLRRLPAARAQRRAAALAEQARKFDLHAWIEQDRRRR